MSEIFEYNSRYTFIYNDINYILDTIQVGPEEFVNIVVVQGYDKANKMSQSQIPSVILNNIEKEIPDENVYFVSENIAPDKRKITDLKNKKS